MKKPFKETKLWKLLKNVGSIAWGLVKPTPLSGIFNSVKEAISDTKDPEKSTTTAWLKLVAYLGMGILMLIALWAGILTFDQFKELIPLPVSI